jgi:hypothetical protein
LNGLSLGAVEGAQGVRDTSDGAVGNSGAVGDANVVAFGNGVPFLGIIGDEGKRACRDNSVDDAGDPGTRELNAYER